MVGGQDLNPSCKSFGPVEKVRFVQSFGWLFLGLLHLVDHVNALLRFQGEWIAISQQ